MHCFDTRFCSHCSHRSPPFYYIPARCFDQRVGPDPLMVLGIPDSRNPRARLLRGVDGAPSGSLRPEQRPPTSPRTHHTRLGALFALALELGLRQSEIAALRWGDFNAERATVGVVHQLRRGAFVPLKSGRPRTLDLSSHLVDVLLLHRRAQAELKLRNGRAYEDRAFIFAVEFASGPAKLGAPRWCYWISRRACSRSSSKRPG